MSTSGQQALSFGWDGRGNQTAKGTSLFGYDAANRLTSANTGTPSTYAYNGEGVRIGKTVGGASTSYLQDVVGGLPKVLGETTNGQQTLYVYGLGLAYEVRPDGTRRYYHSDSLGSTRVVTDDVGAVVSAFTYDSYGAMRASAGEGRAFTYTGEQVDAETAFVFLRARVLDPSTGRFLQRDAVVVPNRYAYANGSPLRYADPSGNDGIDPREVTQWALTGSDVMSGWNDAFIDSVSFGQFRRFTSWVNGDILGLPEVPDHRVSPDARQLGRNLMDALLMVNLTKSLGSGGCKIVASGGRELAFSGVSVSPLEAAFRGGWGAAGFEDLYQFYSGSRKEPFVKVGDVGSYDELSQHSVPGDDIDLHHVPPQAAGFAPPGRGAAIAMNHLHHEGTYNYGTYGDAGLSFREQLARGILDLRRIASQTGASGYQEGARRIIQYWKDNFPNLIDKRP